MGEKLEDLFRRLSSGVFLKARETVEASIRMGWRLDSEIGRRIRTARFEDDTDEEKGNLLDTFLRTTMEEGNFPSDWDSVEKIGVISGILFGSRNDDGTLK